MKTARFIDDLAQMAGGAVSIASSLREQIRQDVKARVEEMADRLDLVPRSDVEKLESMLQEYRVKQEEILSRLDQLENGVPTSKTKKNKPQGKSPAK